MKATWSAIFGGAVGPRTSIPWGALVFGVVLAAGGPAWAAGPRAARVAVYDLEPGGSPPQLARVLTDALVEEIRKLEGIAVVGMSEIRAMLDHEAQKQLAGCSQDSCVSEIAEALGVDALVVGSLATIGTDRILLLKRIDQRAAATAGSFTVRAALDDDATLLASVGPAVQEIFPDRPLRPGAVRGVSERTTRRLHPPPLPTWPFYGALVGTGALLVGAAVTTAPTVLFVGAFEDYKADPDNAKAYDLREHNDRGQLAQAWLVGAVAAWGAATTAGIVTLALWPFTDFEGLGEDDAVGPAGGAP